MMKWPLVASAVGACVLAVACAPKEAPRAAAWTLRVEPVASPAGDASAQPQLTASADGVLLSWLETAGAQTTLKYAARTATGWSNATAVASGRDFFTNWADVPSVVRLSDHTLVAHWLQETDADAEAYDLRLSRSADDGRTWSPAFSPHHNGTKSEHGFATLFDRREGGLGLVWLDGRAMTPPAARGEESTGDMRLMAASFDRGWTQRAEEAIDTRVCECCPTAAALTSEGVIVAFRNRSDDETRDIYVSRLVGGAWTAPAAVHNDGWHLNGCPVNGPAVSAIGRDVGIAWFTAPDDQGHAFVAFSQDVGRTFAAPVRVDDEGSIGRVDVELLPDGSAVVAWIELADRRAAFKVRRVERSGQRSAAVTVTELAGNRSSGYPRMARHDRELVFAWIGTGDRLRVQTGVARLP